MGNMEQAPSMSYDSAERAGCGLNVVLQQQKLRGLGVRGVQPGAACKHFSLIPCCGGFLVPLFPA